MKIIILLSVLALAACASAPVVQNPTQLSATHGYVYLNLPKGSASTVAVESTTNGKVKAFDLLARANDSIPGAGVWLPAGQYRLSKFGGYKLKDYKPFAVEAGRITDLGSFASFDIGDNQFVFLPFRHPSTNQQINQVADEFKGLLTEPPLLWSMPIRPAPLTHSTPSSGLGLIVDVINTYAQKATAASPNTELRETNDAEHFFSLARSMAAPVSAEAAADADGNLYFGADWGQIRVRSPQGEWHSLDTGTLETIKDVALTGNRFAAVTTSGNVLYSGDMGQSWAEVANKPDVKTLTDIDRIGNRWLMTGMNGQLNNWNQLATDRVLVFAATEEDFSDLTLIHSAPADKHFNLLVHGEQSANYYYVLGNLTLEQLDLTTGTWKSLVLPGKINNFHTAPANNTLAALFSAGMFSKFYLSSDDGTSWQKMDMPSYTVTDIYMESPSVGRAIRVGAGMFDVTYELHDYNSSSGKWVKISEAPKGCTRLLPDANQNPRFCITRGGSIVSYTEGKWMPEFLLN